MAENPCRDSGGEKDHVYESLGDIVELTPNLRDGNVTTPCCIAAITVVLGGG